ncbi:hypothetical protein AKJ09_01670 [Labilithrix luteola]|uniref:Uncharacterized protein n=1 Tax=Labilithrix luteola TaxID=1391654 RepID=A0A0K1PNN0_9BACT|nr:hypothetical protein AKJ09_01670 [Labilithrix luteola]
MGPTPEEILLQVQREMDEAAVPYLRRRVERPPPFDTSGQQNARGASFVLWRVLDRGTVRPSISKC